MKEKLKSIKGVVIPEPIMATPRMIVMSYLPGIRFDYDNVTFHLLTIFSIFKDLNDRRRPPMETFKSIATMIGVMGHQILIDVLHEFIIRFLMVIGCVQW